MYKSKQILLTSADFDNAILFGLKIEVWQDENIIDYAGVIESIQPLANLKFAEWFFIAQY